MVVNMEHRKNAILSGLYANTNLDGKESPRQRMIQEMDEKFADAVAKLYDPSLIEEDIDLTADPFFQAQNVPGEDVDWTKVHMDDPKGKPLIGTLDLDSEIDQL